ncbi:porin [uncultured Shewanella sp.]|uniref:porin n=1 Tax=uncultured Shewanella sp. TaxID=173975 RepID=UPI002623D6FF|nr:porin [uncultured Shewanella sp.]
MITSTQTRLALLLLFLPLTASGVPVTDELDLGGAVRVNYGWKDYDSNSKLEFELFRLDVNYLDDDLFASAQYRWYQDMDVIHHAYAGYQFNDEQSLQLGVTQVPFGLLPYGAHSFWFSANYYLGFEDDFDAGIHWKYDNDRWRFDLAYFLNDEYGDGSRYERYSFDVAVTDSYPYEEAGQVNARVEHSFTLDSVKHKLGGSVQYSMLDFTPTAQSQEAGEDIDGIATSLHWQLDWNSWQGQLQYLYYDYEVEAGNRIALSAFAYPFEIASSAELLTVNLSKSTDVDWGPITNLNCYNDFSQVLASGEGLEDSIQNVTGCAISAGKFYSYIDWIAGKNMWFINGPGIGIDNGSTRWSSRLNINIGLYF